MVLRRVYCTLTGGAGWPESSLKYAIVMAKTYQIVTWTDKGHVRMVPSEFNAFLQEELEAIHKLDEAIGYFTGHEVSDLLRLSSACERLALRLMDLGHVREAFMQYATAADCCLWCTDIHWIDRDYDFTVCKPLRGRFFAMFSQCKELVRSHPSLELAWEESGLQRSCDSITRAEKAWAESFFNIDPAGQ